VMHPFAFPKNRSGALGMKAGDRVIHSIDGRCGTADEFLHDGEVFVSWDDGCFGTVLWNHLHHEPPKDADE
jgi:hypothetical protein